MVGVKWDINEDCAYKQYHLIGTPAGKHKLKIIETLTFRSFII